mmetsp:Transcript_5338/g.5501  ORF Transcript_5338/g.5501 Transcript_5338/m.5501 type:complete len:340 (+) Transcript_5338:56-1075(+)
MDNICYQNDGIKYSVTWSQLTNASKKSFILNKILLEDTSFVPPEVSELEQDIALTSNKASHKDRLYGIFPNDTVDSRHKLLLALCYINRYETHEGFIKNENERELNDVKDALRHIHDLSSEQISLVDIIAKCGCDQPRKRMLSNVVSYMKRSVGNMKSAFFGKQIVERVRTLEKKPSDKINHDSHYTDFKGESSHSEVTHLTPIVQTDNEVSDITSDTSPRHSDQKDTSDSNSNSSPGEEITEFKLISSGSKASLCELTGLNIISDEGSSSSLCEGNGYTDISDDASSSSAYEINGCKVTSDYIINDLVGFRVLGHYVRICRKYRHQKAYITDCQFGSI